MKFPDSFSTFCRRLSLLLMVATGTFFLLLPGTLPAGRLSSIGAPLLGETGLMGYDEGSDVIVVAHGGSVYIARPDDSTSATLEYIARVPIRRPIDSISVTPQRFACAAEGDLYVYDTSDPTQPTPVAMLEGDYREVALEWPALVGLNDTRMDVYRLDEAQIPEPVSLPLEADVEDMFLFNQVLTVRISGYRNFELSTYNLSDPSSPRKGTTIRIAPPDYNCLLGTFQWARYRNTAIATYYLGIPGWDGCMGMNLITYVTDVGDGSSKTDLDLQAAGATDLVAMLWGGLLSHNNTRDIGCTMWMQLMEIEDGHSVERARFPTSGVPTSHLLRDGQLIIGSTDEVRTCTQRDSGGKPSVTILDLGDPEDTYLLGHLPLQVLPTCMARAGPYLYVAGESRVEMLDISNPSWITSLGAVDLGEPSAISMDYDPRGYLYIYMEAWRSAKVEILSAPPGELPHKVALIDGVAGQIHVENNFLVALGDCQTYVYSLSDPINPVRIANLSPESNCGYFRCYGLTYRTDTALIATSSESFDLYPLSAQGTFSRGRRNPGLGYAGVSMPFVSHRASACCYVGGYYSALGLSEWNGTSFRQLAVIKDWRSQPFGTLIFEGDIILLGYERIQRFGFEYTREDVADRLLGKTSVLPYDENGDSAVDASEIVALAERGRYYPLIPQE